jgi:hypothetical protein
LDEETMVADNGESSKFTGKMDKINIEVFPEKYIEVKLN